MTTAAKVATKKRVLVSAHVEADMRTRMYRNESVEDYAKRLERECEDFVSHCRDHRSLDFISLSVERKYEDQCTACNRELETVRDPELNGGQASCANCGALLTEGG